MKLHFTRFIFEKHLTPQGLLPREKANEASAAWRFASIAMPILHNIPQQATLETDPDITVSIRQVADSICLQYGITLDTMMAFMDFVKAEAITCGLPWDHRFDTWIRTAGNQFADIVTRDPDKLNIS